MLTIKNEGKGVYHENFYIFLLHFRRRHKHKINIKRTEEKANTNSLKKIIIVM